MKQPTTPPINLYSVDPGSVLSLEGDSVLRVLSESLAPELLAMFREHGGELENHGLVPTRVEEPACLPLVELAEAVRGEPFYRGAHLVHERVPFVTHHQEWTWGMLQEAGLCVLDLQLEAMRHGYRVEDLHVFNVTFKHGKPVFLDASGLRKGATVDTAWFDVFFRWYYLPLWLMCRGVWKRQCTVLAELLLRSTLTPLGDRRRVDMLTDAMGLRKVCRTFRSIRSRSRNQGDAAAIIRSLRDHFASLRPRVRLGAWSDYPDPAQGYDQPEHFSCKARAFARLMEQVPPGRLVDLASSRGWFAGFAAKHGHQVLAVELDEVAIEACRKERATRDGIDVACANVLLPTPPQGRCNACAGAMERWRCDTVLMVALLHHLCIHQGLTFYGAAAICRDFGADRVIAEWIDPADTHLKQWARDGVRFPSWYTRENFERAFRSIFPRSESVESGEASSDTHRVMYLFKR